MFGGGRQHGFDEVVGDPRVALAVGEQDLVAARPENDVELVAGEAEAVLQVAEQFAGRQRRDRVAQAGPLFQSQQGRVRELLQQGVVAHEDQIGAVMLVCVGGRQRLELGQRVLADAHGVLDDNDDARTVLCALGEQVAKQVDLADRALRQIACAELLEQEFEDFVVAELHAADPDEVFFARDGIQRAPYQRRFADPGNARDSDDGVGRRERLFQAFHDVGGLRADKNISTRCLGPERAFFESKRLLVHAGPSALTLPQCTMRLFQQAVCGLGARNTWSYVTILRPQNLPQGRINTEQMGFIPIKNLQNTNIHESGDSGS